MSPRTDEIKAHLNNAQVVVARSSSSTCAQYVPCYAYIGSLTVPLYISIHRFHGHQSSFPDPPHEDGARNSVRSQNWRKSRSRKRNNSNKKDRKERKRILRNIIGRIRRRRRIRIS